MTVAPRYAAYEDAAATGVHVPLDLPWDLVAPDQPEEQVQPLPSPTMAAETSQAGRRQQEPRAGRADDSSGGTAAASWAGDAAPAPQPGGKGGDSSTAEAGRQAPVRAAGEPGPATASSGSDHDDAVAGLAGEVQATAAAAGGRMTLADCEANVCWHQA